MSERLTNGNGICSKVSTDYCLSHRNCYECGHGRNVFKKLSRYEIACDEIDDDRLREIAEAEREGCVYRQVYEGEAVFECSHCGATWSYECGSPIENEQHFCWRCGRPIKSIALLERDENYELIEVEKSMAYKPVGICSGCVHRGEEICGSCARNGRGNDVDFYSKEKEK